ncbi:MAG: hypothetical protein KAX04_01155 [Methanomicrobia archaeon]|nr:hypothetical protein [Methanomicrobia archaeon]
MKKIFKAKKFIGIVLMATLSLGCVSIPPQTTTTQLPSTTSVPTTIPPITTPIPSSKPPENNVKIIFLHHSTGKCIYDGGVEEWFENYNNTKRVSYQITARDYPANGYPWQNYPYDYWNIWVNHGGDTPYRGQDTLEILTEDYDVVVWKHCFPVSYIEADIGDPDISSSRKSIENYKLQYNALKEKMRQFPNDIFIAWTGATLIRDETTEENAQRARQFFNWVKNEWDEEGDNIYIWDFYELEAEGGFYLRDKYASGDSHPSSLFSQRVAPYFCQRIVDVIEERGDNSSIEGR